jgi:hypothetical protein
MNPSNHFLDSFFFINGLFKVPPWIPSFSITDSSNCLLVPSLYFMPPPPVFFIFIHGPLNPIPPKSLRFHSWTLQINQKIPSYISNDTFSINFTSRIGPFHLHYSSNYSRHLLRPPTQVEFHWAVTINTVYLEHSVVPITVWLQCIGN